MDNRNTSLTNLLLSSPVPPDYITVLRKCNRGQEILSLHDPAIRSKHLIPMAIGFPNTQVLPVKSAKIFLSDGSTLDIDSQDFETVGTYGPSQGFQPLRSWLIDLQKTEHQPPQLTGSDLSEPFDLIITAGIKGGYRSTLHALIDQDDSVLMETEVYGAAAYIARRHCSLVTVDHDDEGMCVESLEQILSTWKQRFPEKKMPKVLYAITAGNNPTGYSWSEGRLADVYLICRKYGILILEDGAYHFLQYGGKRSRSFQSMDVDGRVVRFDTFSKILGAGYRVGWVTGPTSLLKAIDHDTQTSYVQASALSQIVIYRMLEKWGYDQFQKEVGKVAKFYERKAKLVLAAADKYLTGLCTWAVPTAGMFLWVRVEGVQDSTAIVKEVIARGLSVLQGKVFTPHSAHSPSIRLAYSKIDDAQIDEAFTILADVIQAQTM